MTLYISAERIRLSALRGGKCACAQDKHCTHRPPPHSSDLQGGFLPEMTRREAAQILGLRESSAEGAVKDAHRRIMIANHPDSGGSSYLATKINEAKDMLLGKKSGPRV